MDKLKFNLTKSKASFSLRVISTGLLSALVQFIGINIRKFTILFNGQGSLRATLFLHHCTFEKLKFSYIRLGRLIIRRKHVILVSLNFIGFLYSKFILSTLFISMKNTVYF